MAGENAFDAAETPSEREFDYDRTVALSDGVFAIALTLLILNVANPEGGSFGDRLSARRLCFILG